MGGVWGVGCVKWVSGKRVVSGWSIGGKWVSGECVGKRVVSVW